MIELPEVDRTRLDPLMSSANPNWETPDDFLDLVRAVFGGLAFLDPCTTKENPCGAYCHIAPPDDGLSLSWVHPGRVYFNPPYGRGIAPWVEKAARHAKDDGIELIGLLPARPDTKWFSHVWKADVVCFLKGRLRFRGAKHSAPFPSVVPYWGANHGRFVEVFSPHGHCVSPY